MKSFKKIGYLLLVILVAYSCSPKMPEYCSIQRFSFSKLGMKNSVISADLKYFNPNKFGLQLQRAEADIFMNGQKIGHTTMDTIIQIPAKDSFALPVKVEVEMKTIFPNALDILFTKKLLFKINGKAIIRKSGIAFPWPINYEGEQRWE